MLQSEQVRQIGSEANLVDDSNTYSQAGSYSDWTTKKTHNITLSAAAKLVVRFTLRLSYTGGSSSSVKGGVRVLVGGTPIGGTGIRTASFAGAGNSDTLHELYAILAAGSIAVDFQVAYTFADVQADCAVRVKDLWIGYVAFSDLVADSGDSGDQALASGASLDAVSKTLTTAAQRKTPLGNLKKITALIIAYGSATDYAKNTMADPGATGTNLRWKIILDGVQQSWSDKQNDAYDGGTSGEGAYGRVTLQLNPGTQITVKLSVENASGASRTVRGYLAILTSPWIVGDIAHEPVSLDFPQGSTAYLVLEPLTQDPSKKVKLGKYRAVSFGDATDYYSTATGTGILSWSYTFEIIRVKDVGLTVEGYGACVAALACDVR